MVENTTEIASLPNELLIQVLTYFSTRTLLPLALVSNRFHDVVVQILHTRLLHAASLKDHKLVLECFHPSSKLSTPHLFCEYLGTDGLSSEVAGEGPLYDDVEDFGRLGKLSGLYSHFKPVLPDEKKVRIPHPAGDVPGHPNTSTSFPGPSEETESEDGIPGSDINLESHELFSQLVTITNLVKVGPRRGLFLSCVNIGEDIIRIRRDWLANRVKANASNDKESEDEYQNRMLWVDRGKTVGLRLRISEQKDVANRPILLGIDEDAPVSYSLHYEELVIRTTQLLLAVEESLVDEENHTGNAVIIGGIRN